MNTSKHDRHEYDSDAAVWLDDFNDQLQFYNSQEATVSWRFSTDMTNETSKAMSDFAPRKSKWMKQKKLEAAKFDITKLDSSRARMLYLIRNLSFSFMDEQLSKNNADLISKMSEIYSTAKVKLPDGTLASGEPDLAEVMHTSKNYEELLYAWTSWRDLVGPKIKKIYPQLISVENKAVKLQGHKMHDMGEIWRSKYEVKDLEKDAVKIWEDLKPLYKEIHAYVRRKLSNHYGRDKVDVTGPIPAHLLGNMWAQEWGGLMDIVKPYDEDFIDITAALKRRKYDTNKIFRTAEDFYVSIGLYPMTEKFWKLSMFEDPGGSRKVDCHGSAEDFSNDNDFRECHNVYLLQLSCLQDGVTEEVANEKDVEQ
ncbi:Angiotensin-converting enzyme [Nymphon striatum]|nr:Angiotensin-converting enzyme [Nymphon striatum]